MCQKSIHIIFLLFALSVIKCNAQTRRGCDTLIKKGIRASEKRDYVKAMEYYTLVHSIAEKQRWQEQLFWAKNNIGATYYSMLDYGEALNYFLDSYKIALSGLPPEYEMAALGNMALLYTKEKNYEKAGEYISKAYNIAADKKDYPRMAIFGINLANNANNRGRPKEAQKIIRDVFKYNKDKGLFNLGNMLLAESELLLGHNKKAREMAQNLYDTADDLDYNEIGVSLLLIIAKSHIAENATVEARHILDQLLAQQPNVETKRTIFGLLADSYAKVRDFRTVTQFKDSLLVVEKEINDLKNGRIYENNKVKFEIENYRNEISEKEEKIYQERKFFIALSGVIVALFIILGLLLRSRSIKYKQQKALAEQKERVVALELEKEKHEKLLLEQEIKEKEANAQLGEELLRSEIESRNRELSSKELYISGRNQLIEEILVLLSENPKLSKDPALVNHIKSLKGHLNNNNEWENFLTHFEQVNNGMLKRLMEKHPTLTSNDIRFIAYIYMNLSIKEISVIFNITPVACGKRKERIATKLDVPKNMSLYSYISGI